MMVSDIMTDFSLSHSGLLKFRNMTQTQRFQFYLSLFQWGVGFALFHSITACVILIWSWDDAFSRLREGTETFFVGLIVFASIGMWVRVLTEFPRRVVVFNCEKVIVKELKPIHVIKRTELEYVALSKMDRNRGTMVSLPTSPAIEIITSTDIETIAIHISQLGYRVKKSHYEENNESNATNVGETVP